jgi:hypothetical protein
MFSYYEFIFAYNRGVPHLVVGAHLSHPPCGWSLTSEFCDGVIFDNRLRGTLNQ